MSPTSYRTAPPRVENSDGYRVPLAPSKSVPCCPPSESGGRCHVPLTVGTRQNPVLPTAPKAPHVTDHSPTFRHPRFAAGALLTFSLLSACAPPDDESIEVLPTSVLDTSGTTSLAPSAFNEGAVNIPGADNNTDMVSPFGDTAVSALPPVSNPGLVNEYQQLPHV